MPDDNTGKQWSIDFAPLTVVERHHTEFNQLHTDYMQFKEEISEKIVKFETMDEYNAKRTEQFEKAFEQLQKLTQPRGLSPVKVVGWVLGGAVAVIPMLITCVWTLARNPSAEDWKNINDKISEVGKNAQDNINKVNLEQVQMKSDLTFIKENVQKTSDKLDKLIK